MYARNVAFEFDSLSAVLKTEISARRLTLRRAFGVPPEWGDVQARQYKKLAERAGIPDSFRDIHNAEVLVKKLIEPCLSGQTDLNVWNTEALAWE